MPSRRLNPAWPQGPTTAAIAVLIATLAAPAQAFNLLTREDSTLDFNIEAGIGLFHSGVDYSGKDRGNVDWQEGYIKGGFKGNYLFSEGGPSLYGALTGTVSGTWGDGDAGGFTKGNERRVDWEDLYLGWKSGNLLDIPDAVDISIGRQTFVIGDGFLVNGDIFSFGRGIHRSLDRGGAYYMAPHRSFEKTLIGRFQSGTPLRAEAFYLGSGNPAQGDTELGGINLEYVHPAYGTLGAYYLRVLDVDEHFLGGIFALRKHLNTYSIRGQGSAGFENTFFSFEFTRQDSHEDIEVDAAAWYLEAGYTFNSLPWGPYLGYRFSHFSGDEPDTLDKSEAFDPLFYGYNRGGYGTWTQGEIAATYAGPFNRNTDVHFVALRAKPEERLILGALYFNYLTDEPPPGVSSHYAQEIDLYIEWKPKINLYLSPLFGLFIPGNGAEATSPGGDKVNYYFQFVTIVYF